MQRGGSTPILGLRVSSSFDERRHGERPKRCGREVERRISDVQLMRNFLYEAILPDAPLREQWRRSNEPHSRGFVGDNRREELEKGR